MLSLRPKRPDPKRAALVEGVVANVVKRIEDGALDLPSMPTAAMECLHLLRTPDFSMSGAAEVIERDPALAARVLSVSNSAAFCTKERARSVSQAVTRLGTSTLRIVLFEAMATPIFESRDVRIRKACAAVWRHSRAVASCGRHMATAVGAGDAGEAYLSGLLHDIGKPILAALLLKSERRLVGSKTQSWLEADTWMDVVQTGHRAVGMVFAEKWKLPEAVASAVADGSTFDESAPRSIVNCVRMANAMAKELGLYVGRVDAEQVTCAIEKGQAMLDLKDADVTSARQELNEAWCSSN